MYFSTGSQLSTALASLSASKVGQFLAFDALYYSNKYMLNGNTTALTPIEHFVQYGAAAMAQPNETFDPVYYKQHYADLSGTNLNAADLLYHFMQFGLDEGRLPSADVAGKFNATAYLAKYPDVAAYVNANLADFGGSASNGALAHYVKFGMAQGFTLPTTPVVAAGTTFHLTDTTIAGSDPAGLLHVMNLTGDQNVRIDITQKTNQITGLDLDGKNGIEANGKEMQSAVVGHLVNVTTADDTTTFAVVDAYSRNRPNTTDLGNNFLGNIGYDGTGYNGDGVTTDGNIVLGGLGTDTIFGGIGNDFLTGGGVAAAVGVDRLSGGRNADFFFVELSTLDRTDGNGLIIDGGTTADNTSVGSPVASGLNSTQDADWVLFQGSDDEEPYNITLVEAGAGGIVSANAISVPRATMTDIENFDASGNLYGFLDNVAVSLGGKTTASAVGAPNNGIGSSAQLSVTGSNAANIIIAGYDNDTIRGDANAQAANAGAANLLNGSDDLLMGGNINFLINPNLIDGPTAITNDGKDFIVGDKGSDHIVFEADGGRIEGGNLVNAIDNQGASLTNGLQAFVAFADTAAVKVDASIAEENDTLWLTANSFGTKTIGDLTTDSRLRIDLNSQNIDASAGYGGADFGTTDNTANDTQDQTKYKDPASRVTVQDMDSVIATGLGAIDYDTDGSNAGDLNHTSQMNFRAVIGNLDLRGTQTANTLYAAAGDDALEGRQGRDNLSGGVGSDDFIFNLEDGAAVNGGDGVDVIHRQKDIGNNITDGTFVQDFGDAGVPILSNSSLTVSLVDTANVADQLKNIPIDGIQFSFKGTSLTLLSGHSDTYVGFKALLETAIAKVDALKGVLVTLNGDNTITLTDPAGGTFVKGGWHWIDGITPADGALKYSQEPGTATKAQTLDRLIYQAYEDRADGEKVDDNSYTGSTISLGVDAYAQDLVVDFAADGTRIAEDQLYSIEFANLSTEDTVTVTVNGVKYSLTVGVKVDGTEIANEDSSTGTSQVNIQANFLARFAGFINSFMDNDTAAGQINAIAQSSAVTNATRTVDVDGNAVNDVNTIVINQVAYNAEQTVFMKAPIVVVTGAGNNGSVGETPWARVWNNAQHEVHLLDYIADDLSGQLTRNGDFDATNVLFLGNSGLSRSVLDTAPTAGGTVTGSEAIVIDGGVDNLADAVVAATDIVAYNNTATNAALALNFAVHGDDLLIGGAGNDTINAGTGDDRVIGSKGVDTLDGGKNFYEVKVLGEDKARVMVLNQGYESVLANSANVPTLKAITDAGKTISSITLINQTQSGVGALVTGVFNDTLQFQQADIGAAASFTVNLAAMVDAAGAPTLRNGGAGTVTIDGTTSVTTFKEFENIRTVSGTGNAVANDGQGNDTLNISALSGANTNRGVSYDLTNDTLSNANNSAQGEVRYSTNPINAAVSELDYETVLIKVDGVENVIAGGGNDLLLIDETEAAKNNSFNAGGNTTATGIDRIDYQNNFAGGASLAAVSAAILTLAEATATAYVAAPTVATALAYNAAAILLGVGAAQDAHRAAAAAAVTAQNDEIIAEPTVTLKVGALASDVDHVMMTGGRLGLVVADDTLTSVERIDLNGYTGQSNAEADVINVKALTAGAIVDYVTGEIRTAGSAAGTNVQVVVGNMVQMERVEADGDDTVIVATSATMATNARSDELNTVLSPSKDITFASWYDFQQANAAGTARLPFAAQLTGDIDNVLNENQFQFNLGTVGSDTVDYSNELGTISAVINFTNTDNTQRVIVDSDSDGSLVDSARVDLLTSVENIVAAQGTSIIDVTNSTKNIKIEYSAGYTVTANLNAATDTETRTVVLSEYVTTGVGGALGNINLVEKIDNNNNAAVPAFTNAAWDRIEGGDMGERVYLTAAESRDAHTMVLRGGNNLVSYQGMGQNTIVAATVAIAPATAGVLFSGVITVTAATTDADPATATTSDVITSYTQDNVSKSGTLELWGGGYGTDTISFAGGTNDKFYQMGVLRNGSSWTDLWSTADRTVPASISLTAFEGFVDDVTNDVYSLDNIAIVRAGFLNGFTDAAGNDHDSVKVNIDAINYNGSGISTVDLDNLSAVAPGGFNFDFDVLDATNLAVSGLILNGGTNVAPTPVVDTDVTDEVVVGALSYFTNINDFESVVLTANSVVGGGTFVLNVDTNRLIQGSTTVQFNGNNNVLSAGGLALESELGNSYVPNLATAVNFSVGGVNIENVTFIGGDANDTLTGAAGADTLVGGKGNDILDGSFVAAKGESQTITFGGGAAVLAGIDLLTLTGNTLTLTISASAGAGELKTVSATADAGQIGALLVAQTYTYLETQLGYTAGSIASTAFNGDSNTFTITFAPSAGPQTDITQAVSAGTMTAVIAQTVAATPVLQSADTYVFASTATLNGVDTINNFNAAGLATDDVLNANSFLTAAVSNTVAANSVAGLDLSGVANYGVMYNQATLATTDISFGAAAAGKVGVEASSKSVVLVSADVDGLADASNTAYDMYYVVAGATAVTSVTKVATINSTAELNASSLVPVLGTAAGNVLTGTAASDTINGLAGADTISGAAGNDFLVGGEDADVITGGAGNDSIDLTETVAAIDKVVFDGAVLLAAASVSTQLTANGLDTIIGFGAIDTINVAALGDGTTGAGLADVVAAAAANSLALTTDRSIVINATGLAASLTTLGTAVITDWTNLTQVAAYLDELVTVTASNQHNVIVFNNTSGANTTTYVYTLSNVGADVTVDAADIGLVGIITHAAGSMVAAQVVYA